MLNRKSRILTLAFVIAGGAVLIATSQPQSVSVSTGSDPIRSVFDDDRLSSDRVVWQARADQMSDEELCLAIEGFREQAKEEARWAQFLDWTMWYIRDSPDQKAHERWRATWSSACNDLRGQTESLLRRIDESCPNGKPAIQARLNYAYIAAALPQIHESRLKISKGVLEDVFQFPAGSPRLAPWE
jgi:hypothetical protein